MHGAEEIAVVVVVWQTEKSMRGIIEKVHLYTKRGRF